ncbi:MAG: 30S ribosomal protein S13 [Candidatus Lokiarchaeota archaeon]|nr:30S ribosomal protein S13 [Candidatus Lokiarchaeota archaeon]
MALEESYRKSSDFRLLIRLIGTSIDGNALVEYGLSQIKGVGIRFSQAVVRVAGIDPNRRMGELSEDECDQLEKIIKNPTNYDIPSWMVNRQKDIRTGEDRHISGTDLDLVLKVDIDRMKRTRSWKGMRHQLGLKVRGQRTRTTGRKGLTVGYYRRKKKTTAK